MGDRLGLQTLLEEIMISLGHSRKQVYGQPPPNIAIEYPCIIYKRDDDYALRANNALYGFKQRYLVTVIDSDVDSPIPDKIRRFPYAKFVQFFTKDNLNHDIYTIYY